jgi:DNA recombination protein RmuC
MDLVSLLTGAALGAAAGAAVAWTVAQGRARREAERLARELADQTVKAVALEERIRALGEAEGKFREAFAALSADALRTNTEEFLKLAGTRFDGLQSAAKEDLEARRKAVDALLDPMRKGLEKVEGVVQVAEKQRAEAYGKLQEQVKALALSEEGLKSETAKLVQALRAPQGRGRWGELQLRRVVELAGMLERCDFREQTTVQTDGGRLRPDLVVHLPGGKNVVVDAKTPLDAYLQALEAKDDATREAKLQDHARQVKEHIRALSQKAYWEQFQPSPEFVLLFLPGEAFFSAALQKDPGLIESGAEQRVILVSPTSLIAVLRAVAYGWQQELIAENAQVIRETGKELCERVRVFVSHYQGVGKGLNEALNAYDRATSSLQSRLVQGMRRMEDLGAGGKEPAPDVEPVGRRAIVPHDGDLVK